MTVNVCKSIKALLLPSGRKADLHGALYKTRKLKNMIHRSVNVLLQHSASCCSLIMFKVWRKQFT